MTQTPSRDWQKDMEWAQRRADADEYEGWTEPLIYWLQESKVYKQSYEGTLTAWKAEKARADAAEAREQRLAAAIAAVWNEWFIWDDKARAAQIMQGMAYNTLRTLYPDTPAPAAPTPGITARPIGEWHEDYGDALWWTFPIQEPPYCGSPLDVDWPNYHTHWTPLVIPAAPAPKEGDTE